MKYSLSIYDDPVFYTEGLSSLLIQKEIFQSVLLYHSKSEFLEEFKKQPTDFVIIGNSQIGVNEITEMSGEIIRLHKKVKLIIIGHFYDLKAIRNFFELGVFCYLDKDTNFEEFLDSVKILKSDKIYVCNSAKERMIDYLSFQEQNGFANVESLTKREIEVMKLICEGDSSKMIAEKLFISVNTVESHRKKILVKLNVKNSIGIVKYAVEHNMLE